MVGAAKRWSHSLELLAQIQCRGWLVLISRGGRVEGPLPRYERIRYSQAQSNYQLALHATSSQRDCKVSEQRKLAIPGGRESPEAFVMVRGHWRVRGHQVPENETGPGVGNSPQPSEQALTDIDLTLVIKQ